jgi:hypothetical protein
MRHVVIASLILAICFTVGGAIGDSVAEGILKDDERKEHPKAVQRIAMAIVLWLLFAILLPITALLVKIISP